MSAASNGGSVSELATIKEALCLLLDVPDNAETHEAALNASAALTALEARVDCIEALPPVVFASDDKEREMLPKGVVLRILRGHDA